MRLSMYASSASPLTPFDYIAAGYWQDFLADRPIAGGIAYESELRDCILDESLHREIVDEAVAIAQAAVKKEEYQIGRAETQQSE